MARETGAGAPIFCSMMARTVYACPRVVTKISIISCPGRLARLRMRGYHSASEGQGNPDGEIAERAPAIGGDKSDRVRYFGVEALTQARPQGRPQGRPAIEDIGREGRGQGGQASIELRRQRGNGDQ